MEFEESGQVFFLLDKYRESERHSELQNSVPVTITLVFKSGLRCNAELTNIKVKVIIPIPIPATRMLEDIKLSRVNVISCHESVVTLHPVTVTLLLLILYGSDKISGPQIWHDNDNLGRIEDLLEEFEL